MRETVETTIWFSKAASLEGLSPPQRQAARDDPRLGLTLALSAVLVGCGPAAPAWPAPAREAVLDAVCRSRGAVSARGIAFPRVKQIWRWAAVVAAVLAGTLLAVHFAGVWPAAHRALTPTGIAWAMADGTIIEARAAFQDYFSGTAADPPDHLIWRLDRLVSDWAKETGAQAKLELDDYNQRSDPTGYTATVRITVFGGDEVALAGLLRRLELVSGLSEVKRYNQQFYLAEKWPQTHYPGRRFVINGVACAYPQDFTKEELDSLEGFLNVLPTETGEEYIAFLKLGDGTRFPLADVVRVRFGPVIRIEDYAKHFDRSKLNLKSFEQSSSVFIPADEVNVDFDPLELLVRRSTAPKVEMTHWYWMNARGYRLVVDLTNRQELDHPNAATNQLVERLDHAVAEWATGIPELKPGGELADRLEYGVVELDGKPVQWQATLWLSNSRLLEGIRTAILAAGVEAVREWKMLPTPDRIDAALGVQRVEHPAGWWLGYILVPYTDIHGSDRIGAAAKASEEQRRAAASLGNQMQTVFNEWLKEVNASEPELVATLRLSETGGVVLAVYIEIGSVNESIKDELKARLAACGAPEPEERSTEEPSHGPIGMVIHIPLFPLERLQGLEPADIASHFTQQEQAWAEDLANRFTALVGQWKVDPSADVAHLDYSTVFRFGDLPIAFILNTDQAPGEEFEQLRNAFETNLGLVSAAYKTSSYDAGPLTEEEKQRLKAPPREDWSRDILMYQIAPERAYQVAIPDEWYKLLAPADWQEIKQTSDRIEEALSAWNLSYPPDAAKGQTAATWRISEQYGIPFAFFVECSRLDEVTMLSIASALQDAGAPEYHYGFGYLNRGTPTLRTFGAGAIHGTGWSYNLIPQVKWMGYSTDEMKTSLKPEELKSAAAMGEKIKAIFEQWLIAHPEFGEPIYEKYSSLDARVRCEIINLQGVVVQARFEVWCEDETQRQQVVDELVQLISKETGLTDTPQIQSIGQSFGPGTP